MSLNHNRVYPLRYLVAEGHVAKGFNFYGPFDAHSQAAFWINDNMHVGSATRIVTVCDVKNDLD